MCAPTSLCFLVVEEEEGGPREPEEPRDEELPVVEQLPGTWFLDA